MDLTGRLSLAQRIVIVVALAAVCAAVGGYIIGLHSGQAAFGWYAYAPLRSTANYPLGQQGLADWARLLVMLGLTLFWALVSLWVLRPARASEAS